MMRQPFYWLRKTVSIFGIVLSCVTLWGATAGPPRAWGAPPPLPLPVVPKLPKDPKSPGESSGSLEKSTSGSPVQSIPGGPVQESDPPAPGPLAPAEPPPSLLTIPGTPGQLTLPPSAVPAPDEPTAVPPPSSALPSQTGTPTQPYSGYGARSVSAEIIRAFAPPELNLPGDDLRQARIERMLELQTPDMGIPSPDGLKLYFTWRVTGTAQVWRMDGPGTFPVQLTGGGDPTTLAGLTPDGHFLILSRDHNGEENPGLYLQRAEGGDLLPILHKPGVQVFLQRVSDDSRTLWYKANDVSPERYTLYCYDLATGMREQVFDREGLWNLDDMAQDGRMLLKLDRGSYWSEYWEYQPSTSSLTPLLGQDARNEFQAVFHPLGKGLLVATPGIGEFRHLFHWQTGTFTDLTPELKWDVAGFHMDRARQRLYLSINENGSSRVRIWDVATMTPLPGPRLPAADQHHAGSSSPDGRFTIFSTSAYNQPSQSTLWDWQTLTLTPWTKPSTPELSPERFTQAVLEHYPARDGTAIPMWVRRPQGCEAGGCPVVVVFHGGPEGQSRPGFHPTAQLFVDAGFVYVEPNVRGSTGYGRSWRDADNGPRRLAVITDIEDAARFIRSSWGKDGAAPKVGVMGGSYGGYSTLMAMTRFSGTYDAGVAKVGISNLLTFLENTAPYRRILRTTEYGDPATDREALLELSPIRWLDQLKDPLLIIQGVSDPRVPVGEALQLYDAGKARGAPVELILFGDEGHGTQKRSNRAIDLGHTLRFFERHLKQGDKMTSRQGE